MVYLQNQLLTMRFNFCIIFVCSVLSLVSCTVSEQEWASCVRDLPEIEQVDTLRVITMYGPTSYFLYRDNQMGYEYEIAQQLCRDMGVEMKVLVAHDVETMVRYLLEGKGDLIAYRVPYTHQYKPLLLYTQRQYISNQVLVQCHSDSLLKTVLDLSVKTITVPAHSIYEQRLHDLNDEIGGGLQINLVDDTVSTEQLIAQVAHRQLSYTISDDLSARVNKTYFGNIDYSLNISFPQRSAWVVSPSSPLLLAYIDAWVEKLNKKNSINAIYYKYFEKSKYFESEGLVRIPQPGRISSFDYLFKEYAPKLDWDWRLLAAVAYKESKFNPDVVSWAGACGLMQLMPNTALSLGITMEEIFIPEKNVQAAVSYLRSLERLFPGVSDEERTKFVLASYNAGPGHIFDARALAAKYGQDPDIWSNVREFLLKKSDPEFYNDEVCRFGYCRGGEPVAYVDIIMEKYAAYQLWAR